MLVYPPDKHQTDSKKIFFVGSADSEVFINDERVELNSKNNFCKIVDLKLGENNFKVQLDDQLIERQIIGVKADLAHPVAYARQYENFTCENHDKKNILRSVIIEGRKVYIPLNIPPAYQLEQINPYEAYLDLGNIESDLDWIYYQNINPLIEVGEVKNARLPLYFKQAVKCILEDWSDNNLILELKLINEDNMICIDPGHGGTETGTMSLKGIPEKDLNLSFSEILANELAALDFKTCLTRTEDEAISLQERIEIAKTNKAKYYVAIHHNALPDGLDPNEHRGFSLHYYHHKSQAFANYLASKMKDFLDIPLHGIYQQNLHVLRENPNVFGVLIELGYLIHPIESDIISDRTFQEKTAKIIAKAIQNFSIEKW